MSKILKNLDDKEKEFLEKFWGAWLEVRDTSGWGEVRVTMQAKRWGHIFKTVSEKHDNGGKEKQVGKDSGWKKKPVNP